VNRCLILSVLLAAAAFAPLPVLGQASGESCATIEDEARRLICYDLVFRKQPAPLPAAASDAAALEPREEMDPELAALWPVTTVPTPVGNGMLVTVANNSPEPMSGSDLFARMIISCGNNSTSLRFVFPGYFMTNDGKSNMLELQIDGGEAQTFETNAVDSILNFGGTDESLPVIQQLMAANTVSLTATPSSGAPIKASFDLQGMSQALTPVREACNW